MPVLVVMRNTPLAFDAVSVAGFVFHDGTH